MGHDGLDRTMPRSARAVDALLGRSRHDAFACPTGCSTPGVDTGSFTVFADAGKYRYYSCEQVTAQMKHWGKREEDLRLLMGKAEQVPAAPSSI